MPPWLPIDAALAAIAAWFAIAATAMALLRAPATAVRLLYPAGALVAAAMLAIGLWTLAETPQTAVLPLGLPGLPMHFRLDALSGLFLVLLGAATLGVSVYSTGYFGHETAGARNSAPTAFHYHVFLAGMAIVFIADDAYVFMLGWETMALASYFLVTTDHRHEDIRNAGYLYLLMAHVGALAILLSFGALSTGLDAYTFASMRAADPAALNVTAAFVLAVVGFGAKAGLVPLHAWLPEAHPAAPSPVSALMSGVMLKTAVYGLLRVGFDLLPHPAWWWGLALLVPGLASALFGAMMAAVQNDMKRLLAWSSVENSGIIATGLGAALLFRHYDMHALAALSLLAALYHAINHSLFKSLLFLATGSVLHATAQRSLGRLGGLIHRMPWVAWLALVGTLAIAGLPPLNGFASEWLLLQALLFTPDLPNSWLSMLLPLSVAALALATTLAGYVMVKFYGVVFLGQAREKSLTLAHDAGIPERIGLAWLASGCVALGVMPFAVVAMLQPVATALLGAGPDPVPRTNGLFLFAISPDRASYSPLLFLLGGLSAGALIFMLVRRLYHGRVRRAPAWDCGFPWQDARMQDTAEGFGQPIRQIFAPAFRYRVHVPTPFDERPRYEARIEDRFWHALYLPTARATGFISGLLARLQHGRIHLYLVYSFITLLVLLLLVRL